MFCRFSNNRDYSNHNLHNMKRLASNSFVPTIVYVEEKTKAKVLLSQNLRQFGQKDKTENHERATAKIVEPFDTFCSTKVLNYLLKEKFITYSHYYALSCNC